MAGRTFINGREVIDAHTITMLEGGNETSPLLDIKQSPSSATANYIARVEADGSNWDGGSRCLLLVSDDDSCMYLEGNDGSTTKFRMSRSGKLTLTSHAEVGGNVELTSGGSVTSTVNGTILIAPDGTGGIGFFDSAGQQQQAHIVDADGTLADITTKFNTLLADLEGFGLLASS